MLVVYQESLHEARSTKCKLLQLFCCGGNEWIVMKNVGNKEHGAVIKEMFVLQFKLKFVEHKCHTIQMTRDKH